MAEKVGIYAGPPMIEALEGAERDRSFRINTVCDRYNAIMARSTPRLTRNEWCMVADTLNGTFLGNAHSIEVVWAEIADGERVSGLGAKWGVDADALAFRVRGLEFASKVALVEAIERFWRLGDGLQIDEALAKAGIKPEAA